MTVLNDLHPGTLVYVGGSHFLNFYLYGMYHELRALCNRTTNDTVIIVQYTRDWPCEVVCR